MQVLNRDFPVKHDPTERAAVAQSANCFNKVKRKKCITTLRSTILIEYCTTVMQPRCRTYTNRCPKPKSSARML